MSNRTRNSNIEILRIISIFLIILNHYSAYGGIDYIHTPGVNSMIVELLHSGGKLGVNIFLFISGWYLCDSQKCNIKRPFYLITEVLVYSIAFVICGLLLSSLQVKEIIKMVFAIPHRNWEFITCYFMMICFAYWINLFLNNITANQFTVLIVFVLITWSIFPTLVKAEFGMSTLTWYVFVYLLAAYVKRIYDKIILSYKQCFLIGILSYVFILCTECILKWMGRYHIKFAEMSEHLRQINSLFIVLTVVFLFLGFEKLPPHENKVIQQIASTSLAVFIIHDNGALRSFIWNRVFHTADLVDSPFLLLHALIASIAIFVFGFIIDMIRQNTIGKVEKKYLN